jgi:hypothetical protein
VVANPSRNKLKQEAFELLKLSAQRCLEPSETCWQPVIRAHSIQNASILERLCRRGHVITPKLRAGKAGNPGVAFELIGRRKASTFTGLCGVHDHDIFDPIDTGPINTSSDEHLFLLAYRSVIRELHAVISGAVRIQVAFQRKVELGLVRGDVPTPDGVRALQFCMNAYESYLYKREYDVAYTLRDFTRIEHVRFFEPGWLPTLAVSALFSLDSIVVGDDVARVALNIYPLQNGVMVIFSFLSCDARYIEPFIEPFKAASGERLLRMISARVLNSCENFVLAPDFWNALGDMRKNAICDFYVASLWTEETDLGNPDLMLFSPEQA